MLYIPLIEATATSSAPGVAWIMVGKQCARRAVLGFLRRDIRLLLWQRGTSRQNPSLPASSERLLYCLVSYITPYSRANVKIRETRQYKRRSAEAGRLGFCLLMSLCHRKSPLSPLRNPNTPRRAHCLPTTIQATPGAVLVAVASMSGM